MVCSYLLGDFAALIDAELQCNALRIKFGEVGCWHCHVQILFFHLFVVYHSAFGIMAGHLQFVVKPHAVLFLLRDVGIGTKRLVDGDGTLARQIFVIHSGLDSHIIRELRKLLSLGLAIAFGRSHDSLEIMGTGF